MAPRYHIDTIPVWDALHKQEECLLCILRRQTEHLLADRYLGGSVMEPSTRIRVNEKGFCQAHHKMLFQRQNKLGHALLMLSHLKEVRRKLDSKPLVQKNKQGSGFFSFKSKSSANKNLALNNLTSGCVLCDGLEENINRYAYTILHLWKTDKAFQKEFSASKGVCLPDANLLIQMSEKHLTGQDGSHFRDTLVNLLAESFSRLEEELEWFTLKFDYRNSDRSWGTSKDALERSITKLRGWSVGKDPGKED
jgi:hypothetical protein